MAAILTVTVNPCIDISAKVPALIPDKKLKCTEMKKEPGGGGINVSRVIKRLGGETRALYLAGGYSGDFFTSMLRAEGVDTRAVPTVNETRENFIVAEESTSRQYRFGMPGPLISEAEWQQCLREIEEGSTAPFIVASGSLTGGIPTDFFARLSAIARRKNACFILDTSGEPLTAALREGVYMLKPNLGELSHITGVDYLAPDAVVEAARSVIARGQCEVMVVSMAAQGAWLVTASFAEHLKAPAVQVKSTVGAGDSMVAGMVWSLAAGHDLKVAFRYGIACGSATTMKEGTALCQPADVQDLFGILAKQ